MNCPLSPRQLDAVRAASSGKVNKVSAFEIGISVNVMTNYLQIARLKTGTKNTVQLVALALREGWIK